MIDFIEYVVGELRSKRLSKTNAVALVRQFSLRSSRSAAALVLHPLLHRNTSDLSEQRYTSTFTGDEWFMQADPVGGGRRLSAAAYLEMARAAIADAWPAPPDAAVLTLRDIRWAPPVGLPPTAAA